MNFPSKTEIEDFLKEKLKDRTWCITALVYCSYGYFTPESAAQVVEEYLKGKRKNFTERCIACFSADLSKMLYHDFVLFEDLQKREPARAERLIEIAKKINTLPRLRQLEISMFWPTLKL